MPAGKNWLRVGDSPFSLCPFFARSLSMYAQLNEIKLLLGITHTNNDAALTLALESASALVDKHCQRTFTEGDEDETRYFRPCSTRLVLIDDLVSVTTVATGTAGTYDTEWEATDFQLEPGNRPERPYDRLRAIAYQCFPYAYEEYTVAVTGTWGWPAVPAPVKQATLLLGTRLYKRKDTIEGAIGFADAGAALRISGMDPDVAAIIARYRKVTL